MIHENLSVFRFQGLELCQEAVFVESLLCLFPLKSFINLWECNLYCMFGSTSSQPPKIPSACHRAHVFCSLLRRQAEEEVARTREDEEVGLDLGEQKVLGNFGREKKQPNGPLLSTYKWSYISYVTPKNGRLEIIK